MDVVIRVAVLMELMHSAHLHTSRLSHILQLTCKPAYIFYLTISLFPLTTLGVNKCRLRIGHTFRIGYSIVDIYVPDC